MRLSLRSALPHRNRLPNPWDAVAILCVVTALIGVTQVARDGLVGIDTPGATEITLDPGNLPEYAVRTTLRMFAALGLSLLFALTYGAAAAKSPRARLILVPLLDVLQSVPILGFLTFTVVFFMSLFPGHVLGLELAAIFAIFTSQAWNMAFSVYQSLSTLPSDLTQAARAFQLTAWQRFWRLELPFATPGLVWNTMISMSGGWFFVVASEAVAVGDQTWKLPGIGSFVAVALEQRDLVAVAWAILAMLVVIVLYDQLLFRPLVAWSAKFNAEADATTDAEPPWVLRLMRRTRLLRWLAEAFGRAVTAIGGLRLSRPHTSGFADRPASPWVDRTWLVIMIAGLAWAALQVADFAISSLHWRDVIEAIGLGVLTLLRVSVMIALASLIWVPIGVWFGLRPVWARRAQPVTLFLSAFPANLLFPPFVLTIVHLDLNPHVWLTPLMILGTQWFILFNVIAGAAAFPGDLREVARNLRVGGWLWWRRVMLPAVFPYYVTGAIAASGGSWNAAIVAEVASWGDTRLTALGLGAYIADATERGDIARVVLGVVVMSGFVVLMNRFVWRPMQAHAARRASWDAP